MEKSVEDTKTNVFGEEMMEYILAAVFFAVPVLISWVSNDNERVNNVLKYYGLLTIPAVLACCCIYLMEHALFWGAVFGK